MPTVTRNTLWFYAANIPYVDFEVKGVQLFFNFRKSLTFCVPQKGKKATFEDQKKEIPDWTFWFIADDSIEISCYQNIKNLFSFKHPEKGITISFEITVQEAKEIKRAVEQMIQVARRHQEEFLADHSKNFLRPFGIVFTSPVETYRWVTKRRYPLPKKTEAEWKS